MVIYRSDLLSLMDAIKYFPIYSIKLPIKLFPIKIPISYTRLEVLVDAVAVMTTVAAAVSVTAGGGAMPVPPPPVPPPPHRPTAVGSLSTNATSRHTGIAAGKNI